MEKKLPFLIKCDRDNFGREVAVQVASLILRCKAKLKCSPMIKMQSNWPEPYGESGIRTNVQPIYHVVNSITGIHSLSIE